MLASAIIRPVYCCARAILLVLIDCLRQGFANAPPNTPYIRIFVSQLGFTNKSILDCSSKNSMKCSREKYFLSEKQVPIFLEYEEKWAKEFLSTNKPSLASTEEAIALLYQKQRLRLPEIVHCQSPLEVLEIARSLRDSKGGFQRINIHSTFVDLKEKLPMVKFGEKKMPKTDLLELSKNVYCLLSLGIRMQAEEKKLTLDGRPYPRIWLPYMGKIDFFLSYLEYLSDAEVNDDWELSKRLFRHCDYIFATDTICAVSSCHTDRRIDSSFRLHACAEPAVSYSGKLDLYFYHGYWLPAKYGKFPFSEWKPEWLLQESREDIRQALIQGIGLPKILHSLNAHKIDRWREYTLFAITPVQVAPIPLNLKIVEWNDLESDKSITVEVPLHLNCSMEAAFWAESMSFHLRKFRGYPIRL